MQENLKKIGIPTSTTLAASALLLIAPILAFADTPHFLFADSSLSGSSLVCFFKEVGLGNLGFSSMYETCSATATAIYECVNNGGNHPKATNKETVTSPVKGSGTFPISNGQANGVIIIGAPGPGSFSCPGGQTRALFSVTYTNMMLCDQLGNCVKLVPPTQTFTNSSAPTP